MALTDIASSKDSQQSHQPLLLATFTFPNGSIWRASTHPLSTAEGGYQYGGNTYTGRIESQQITAVQGYDAGGIGIISRVQLTIADPDKLIKTTYADVYGFTGAVCELTFLLWDADTSTFSSDSIIKFRGICDSASCDFKSLSISATSDLSLQRRALPSVPLQRRCPWIFPTTAVQRQDGADNADSPHYECGYSPDATGSNARGNYQTGTTPYATCGYTAQDCRDRGMFKTDSSSRVTGRFGGSQYESPATFYSRDYTSGERLTIQNNPNETRWGAPVQMVYGTAWVDAIVMPTFGDGNSTRFEAIVCLGEVQNILRVVVNDLELPPATDITGGTSYRVRDPLLRYNVINQGDRNGAPNLDAFYDGNGDPYGSMCAILCVVPRRAAEASSAPRVRVLVQGPKIRVYSDTSTYTLVSTSNPVWVLMDLLAWAGVRYSRLDIQSFIDAAAICDGSVSYTDQYGGASSHARYSCSLVLKQRRSAAEIIRAVRQGCGAILVANSTTGKVQIFIEGTLASQQPSAVTGSNYNTAISSKSLAGSTVNGYVAYDFQKFLTERGDNSLKISVPPITASPNKVQFGFANSEREYSGDSIAIPDTSGVALAGQEVSESFEAEGINTLDQARRIGARRLARNLRGNIRSDAGGTEHYEWLDSFRMVRARVGHICRLSSAHYGVSNQLVRLIQITPSQNFETARIVAQHHKDDWYLDTYGQFADSESSAQARNRLDRPSYAWGPVGIAPNSGDPMLSTTAQTFTLAEEHETAADGTTIARLAMSGAWPVNIFAALQPPTVGRQGTTATTGGAITGGRAYYMAVVSLDAFGAPSAPSSLCEVVVTNTGSANTITVSIVDWPSGAAGYVCYVGDTPQLLTEHASNPASTPSSITVTSYQQRGKGMPDIEFDRMRVKVKRVAHSGVFGAAATAVGTGTIQIASASWTVNEWAGYNVSILGRAAGGDLGVLNYAVTSNTATTLTVTPDPSADVAVGDAVIMRSNPTVGSDSGGNYISDAKWVNGLSGGAGLAVNEEVGRLLRIIAGPGEGQAYRITANTATKVYVEGSWLTTPTSASRYIIEEPDWQVIQTSDSLNNADLDAVLYLSVEVTNYKNSVVIAQPVTLDGGGNEAFESLCPVREIYIFGQANSAISNNDGYVEMPTVSGAVTPDIGDGLNQQESATGNVTINNPIYTGGTIVAGMRLKIKVIQDSTGGRRITWGSDYVGLANEDPDLTADTYSIYEFVYNTASKWELHASAKGRSIT